jgi:hypothetical protein
MRREMEDGNLAFIYMQRDSADSKSGARIGTHDRLSKHSDRLPNEMSIPHPSMDQRRDWQRLQQHDLPSYDHIDNTELVEQNFDNYTVKES